jgi:hypothetical protein
MAEPITRAQIDPNTGQVLLIDVSTGLPANPVYPGYTTTGQQASAAALMAPAPPPMAAPFAPAQPGLDPQSIISALRSYLTNTLIPQRQAAIGTAIPGLQQVANASPLGLLLQLGPQVAQAGRQATTARQQASRQLGPGGGGQIDRATQGINANLAQALAQLFAQATSGAGTGLLDIAQGTSSFLPRPAQQATGTSTHTETGPADIRDTAMMIRGLYGLGQAGYGLGSSLGGLGSLFGPQEGISYGGGLGWS